MIGFESKYLTVVIKISNRTDNFGTETANQLLPLKRAEVMVNYLIINEVNSQLLIARGYG